MRNYCNSLKIVTFLCIFIPLFSLQSSETLFKQFTFSNSHENWSADFSDYPVNEENFYQLSWGWENLPSPLDADDPNNALTKGLFLSGNNHSDDLFMFIKRRIKGLKPNTSYFLTFEVLIESNVAPGMMGVGGSPGEDLFFKVGASAVEPKKIEKNGFYMLNVDKGNQAEGGDNAVVIGNLANELVDPFNPLFQPKQLTQEIPLQMTTDENGQLWIFLGTDSAFESLTKFYIAKINLTLSIK